MPRIKVLVVEDDAIIAAHLSQVLERFGYEVPAVLASAEEALRGLPEWKPDVILMDVRLRGSMNGIEAGQQAFRSFGTGVVFLSAFSLQSVAKLNPLEPFGCLSKPVKEEDVHAAIQVTLCRMEIHRLIVDERRTSAEKISRLHEGLEEIKTLCAGTNDDRFDAIRAAAEKALSDSDLLTE